MIHFSHFISGSIDNSAIIWNTKNGDKLAILREHKGLVQGVSWDPRNVNVATLSTDRCLRLFSVERKYRCTATIFKMARKDAKAEAALTAADEQNKENSAGSFKKTTTTSNVRLYHDDTMKSFFRRPAFSPDGQLLVTPAGMWTEEDETKPTNAAFIYNLKTKEPAVRLPLNDKSAIAVRFCPTLFALRSASAKRSAATAEDGAPSQPPPVVKKMINLPYRMVFAVATDDCVIIYDTQQTLPLGIVGGIHYHQLSDLTWSPDGRLLLVASTDGFCSVISFEAGELGTPYEDAATAMKEIHSVVSVWKPKEETKADAASSSSSSSSSARKSSARASKTKALEQNAKEIAAQMEAKAQIEQASKKTEESTTEGQSEKKEEKKEAAMTVIKPKTEEGKRRIPLTLLSSSSSSSSSTFTSSSVPPREPSSSSCTTAAASIAASVPDSAAASVSAAVPAVLKEEGKTEPRRIQLQPAPSGSAGNLVAQSKQPRRIQLTSLALKTKDQEDESMES